MQGRWMTVAEVAAERRTSVAEAQRFLDAADCPKVFRLHGTVYLL